jgi:multidrug resistance efflux pump
VHKGDLLTVIDLIDYKIGVSLAEAAVEHRGERSGGVPASASADRSRGNV